MEETYIDNPETFFTSLGGLHDAKVEKIAWSPTQKVIVLEVGDLNSNFQGLPEYKERKPSEIVFGDTIGFVGNLEEVEGALRVYELALASSSVGYKASVTFSPAGRISFECGSVILRTKP